MNDADSKPKKIRIDVLMMERGVAASRSKAQAMVMAGEVLVDEKKVEKPSEQYGEDAVIRIKGDERASRYVSRGGLKLEAALEAFSIDASGKRCIDIGSSTGGFTDCLLQHGASHVTAIDAGTNQLDWKLRSDERVEVRENTNARYLSPDVFLDRFDIAVMDVSFISVTKIIPAVIDLLVAGGVLIVLIKPQFEVGKGEVGKGGIVRDAAKHERVIAEVLSFASTLGLQHIGTIGSPITGAEGNKEFLAAWKKS
ncbi:MAG: TlyA family RNA methyltransferase [Acidobacteria bacterium]|nr:TlyA family RNA methyltransferase [Acidobacteriota bacterium]